MGWDPVVLRKYNATGHFRLLNQLRGEIRERPLIRPGEGETVGAVNRSRSLIRAIQARAQAGISRSRRAAQAVEVRVLEPDEQSGAAAFPPPPTPVSLLGDFPEADGGGSPGFRARLDAIDLR